MFWAKVIKINKARMIFLRDLLKIQSYELFRRFYSSLESFDAGKLFFRLVNVRVHPVEEVSSNG
ncbi:hypothetical protein BKP56_09165 [Marinilactibacillus sp. 15R]|nr:hypothetical protein BKP56_09165 [Marinilactibacillus sp. 15R]